MARMPGAVWLGEHSPRTPMSRYDAVCVHTIVGWAPAHAAHFSVKLDGTIQQSRDTAFRSAGNLDGNHRIIVIENEDGGKDIPLTPEQVESNAQILAWVHGKHGVPLQLCPDSRSGSRGLAVHRQGIDGNFTLPAQTLGLPRSMWLGRVDGGEHWSTSFGKTCPRDNKIAQVPAILARAKQIAQDEPDADLTVVAANLHNEERAVDRLGRLKFDAALVSEAHHRRGQLRKLKGRYLTGPQRGPSQEVGILLRGLGVRGFASTFLSRVAKRFKRVGKERWGHDAVIKVGRRQVALVVAHPVAGPKALNGDDPKHPLVKRYAAASRWIDETIAGHKAAGRDVVFGGDVQVRPGNDRPWSVYRVLAKHGMSFHNDGIDVVAWTDGLAKVSARSHDIGSDHPAVRVGLNIRRNK